MKPSSGPKKQTQTKPIPPPPWLKCFILYGGLPPNFGACSLPSLVPATPGWDIVDQFTSNAHILPVLRFWKKTEKYEKIVKNA